MYFTSRYLIFPKAKSIFYGTLSHHFKCAFIMYTKLIYTSFSFIMLICIHVSLGNDGEPGVSANIRYDNRKT